MTGRMRIGELAEKANVTPRTIRYYEDLGLLGHSRREEGKFRSYADIDLARLEKIDALKKLGLSLEEIGSVIDLYFEEASALPGKQKVLSILETHLQETDEKIASMEHFRHELLSGIARMKHLIKEAQQP